MARPDRARPGLTTKQRIAVVAPVVLMATMYPVFRLFDGVFGDYLEGYLGWYLGLVTYWIVWGGGFSIWMLGPNRVKQLLRPRRLTLRIALLIAFPVAMAGLVLLIPGMGYEKHSWGVLVLLFSTPLGHGLFEETLWRGVYLELFRRRFFWRVVWASVWFGLWHIIPVSVNAEGWLDVPPMVLGPMAFGFYLAYVARKTNSVWWPMIAHILGGFVMIS